MQRIISVVFLLILWFMGTNLCAQDNPQVIHYKSQFRGVWIASVRNLDWPSKPGLKVKQLKNDYIRQLEKLREIGMNAVIVQIRPVGDALYPSPFEPWSEYLTGVQGDAPKKGFDPLEFIIEETHKRSMEFHAWFNPYRAIKDTVLAHVSPGHTYFQHPEWFVKYGGQVYFDPGIVPARKFVEKVIADVVTRYDIDAVHFDDYYYPYRVEGAEYPDSSSFAIYGSGFAPENIEDWRRENINLLVRELADTINQLKPWVHFGISPFGVWRNKSKDPRGSETHTIQTNYDDLFGDALNWVEQGWLDYIIPQCYQYLGRPIMDYRVVTQWWNEHHANVNFYIGQGPFRLGNPDRGIPWTQGNEIDRQLYYNDSVPDLLGSAYFRSQTFLDNPLGISDTLKNKFYKFPALPPQSYHDRTRTPSAFIQSVQVKSSGKKIKLFCDLQRPSEMRYLVIYKSNNTYLSDQILDIHADSRIVLKFDSKEEKPTELFVTVVDKYRIESEPYQVVIK